jgi:hypothetical protein
MRSSLAAGAECSGDVESMFLDTGGGRLFCTLVTPAKPSGECMVYFAPLFEERMWCQRIAFNFAREMARAGVAVALFDYYGYGESDGSAEEFSIQRVRSDVNRLLDFLETRKYVRFTFWGIRTGCPIALASMPSGRCVRSCVFWAPVLNLADYIYDGLRAAMSTQLLMFKQVIAKRDVIVKELLATGSCVRDGYALNNIDGYRFSRSFYEEVRAAANIDLSTTSVPTLVVELARPGTPPGSASVPPMGTMPGARTDPQVVRVCERPFWTIGKHYSTTARDVYAMTLEWMRRRADDSTIRPLQPST